MLTSTIRGAVALGFRVHGHATAEHVRDLTWRDQTVAADIEYGVTNAVSHQLPADFGNVVSRHELISGLRGDAQRLVVQNVEYGILAEP